MCNPASFVVTRNAVLFDKDGDSHEVIIKNNGLVDNTLEPLFVRVEIIPPNDRYDLPFEQWKFRVDQDEKYLPDWFDSREVEIAVRTMLPEWWKHHANTPICEQGQTRVITEGMCVVNGGKAWFRDNTIGTVYDGKAWFFGNSVGVVYGGTACFHSNTVGTVYGGVAWFFGNAVGTIHGGVAHVYNRNCKVVLAEGSTGEIVNHF